MDAEKLVRLVNAHVAANTPITGINCKISFSPSLEEYPDTMGWSDEDIAINAAMGNNSTDLGYIDAMAKLQDEEQAAFEENQLNLTPEEEQDVAMDRHFSNEEANFWIEVKAHEAKEKRLGIRLRAADHIQWTIDARRNIPECCDFGDDVSTTEMIDNDHCLSETPLGFRSEVPGRFYRDELGEHDPFDAGDFGAGTRGDQLFLNTYMSDEEVAEVYAQNRATQADLSAQSASDMAKEDYYDELINEDGILCDNCGDIDGPYHECGDADLTENERMALAGASDEEIAAANHIESLNDQLAEARDSVASLLARIDDLCGPDMHYLGHTPSWYVDAAAISYGIKLR